VDLGAGGAADHRSVGDTEMSHTYTGGNIMTSELSILKPDLPFSLQVEITSQCNLKCTMCPLTTESTPSSITPGHMKEMLWEDLMPLARQVGQVTIAGFGEPLVNRNCIPFLKELDRHSIWTSMATNGTALTPYIAKQLSAIHSLQHINVSIDSPDPVIYHEIRGGNVEKALTGLKNLMECIDNPYRVTVSSVVMLNNIATLPDFPPILAKLGVKTYILQGLINYNPDSYEENPVSMDNVASYVAAIRQACQDSGITLTSTIPERLNLETQNPQQALSTYYRYDNEQEELTKQCNLPWEMPYIDKDGKVYPCCYAASQSSSILGDINDARLEDIWLNAEYQKFRSDILDGRTTPDICRSCIAVPLDRHHLRLYAAKVLLKESLLEGRTQMRLVVQNISSETWTQDDLIRIGTAHPRDHASAYEHPSWLGWNRVTSFIEKRVLPGGIATFPFVVQPAPQVPFEEFQLVAEGKCWIPNTRFKISPAGAH
jgi:radical SAM protein with 4Fe4S-binding SPASM domain